MDGGTTFPCLLSVSDEAGNILTPHVVKIFQQNHLAATCKEVFANILAQEFDLCVPPPALIKVDIRLLNDLRKIHPYRTRSLEPGYYFGTELLKDTLNYSPTLESKVKTWRPEIIFAFDVLIRNSDRRLTKPNFFLVEGEPILIDHELSLKITKPFRNYKVSEWGYLIPSEEPQNSGHVFFTYLQQKEAKGQLDFGLFFDYLRVLDPNILMKYDAQLVEFECYDNNIADIVNYLAEIKQYPDKFYALLKELLK